MMTTDDRWRADQLLAWTERDGPGRPPAGPPRLAYLGLAGTLGAILLGMLSADTLCPEHRMWVQHFATAGTAVGVAAVIALIRHRSAGVALALVSAAFGMGIGVIDTVHSSTRGGVLALVFAFTALLACVLAVSQHRLARFGRTVAAAAAPLAVEEVTAVSTPSTPREGARQTHIAGRVP